MSKQKSQIGTRMGSRGFREVFNPEAGIPLVDKNNEQNKVIIEKIEPSVRRRRQVEGGLKESTPNTLETLEQFKKRSLLRLEELQKRKNSLSFDTKAHAREGGLDYWKGIIKEAERKPSRRIISVFDPMIDSEHPEVSASREKLKKSPLAILEKISLTGLRKIDELIDKCKTTIDDCGKSEESREEIILMLDQINNRLNLSERAVSKMKEIVNERQKRIKEQEAKRKLEEEQKRLAEESLPGNRIRKTLHNLEMLSDDAKNLTCDSLFDRGATAKVDKFYDEVAKIRDLVIIGNDYAKKKSMSTDATPKLAEELEQILARLNILASQTKQKLQETGIQRGVSYTRIKEYYKGEEMKPEPTILERKQVRRPDPGSKNYNRVAQKRTTRAEISSQISDQKQDFEAEQLEEEEKEFWRKYDKAANNLRKEGYII